MELTAPDASGGVAAGGAGGLLDVVGPAAAPPAQRVGLVAPLTCDPEPAQTSVHGWTLVGAQPSGIRAAHSCSREAAAAHAVAVRAVRAAASKSESSSLPSQAVLCCCSHKPSVACYGLAGC